MQYSMRRKLHIGKYTVPTLALLALMIGSVAAIAYVVLQFAATVTVVANPKVAFVEWATNSKKNTFNYAVNVFPSIKTIDENITNGVWNWDTVAHTSYLRVQGITNPSNVQVVYLKVYNGTTTVVTVTWNSGETLPQSWTTFTAAANSKYTIWMEVTAASGAVVGQASVVTVEMKVESP